MGLLGELGDLNGLFLQLKTNSFLVLKIKLKMF